MQPKPNSLIFSPQPSQVEEIGLPSMVCLKTCKETSGSARELVACLSAREALTSFTYSLDETHTSNPSDKVLAVPISPDFAYGQRSGTLSDNNGGQIRVYLRHFAATFSHTNAGSVGIVLGLAQFNTTLQFKYPAIHRFLGML